MPNNRSERKALERMTPVVEVSAQQARDNLAEFLNRAEYRGERIKIVRHGKAIAALIGLADFDRLNEAAWGPNDGKAIWIRPWPSAAS